MKDESLDMLFMRERTEVIPHLRLGEVNAGFYVVHCNTRTRSFWQTVLQEEQACPKMEGHPPYTDQFHLNRGLGHRRGAFPQEGAFGVRWATIPDYHCIWSTPSGEEVKFAAFHHAVNTRDKPQLLRAVRQQVCAVQQRQPPGLLGKLPLRSENQGGGSSLVAQIQQLTSALRGVRAQCKQLNPAELQALCYLREESEALLQASESNACCASCGISGFWWTLRWSSEDGQGYCRPCWLHWSSDLQDNQQRSHYSGAWADDLMQRDRKSVV